MQEPLKPKKVGEDIAYPVTNRRHTALPDRAIVEDDDYDQVCDCASQSLAIVITGLLNKHRPHEWKGG